METDFKRSTRVHDIYSESTSEYVLPDYNNDIRKILFTEARVRQGGKFVGNDEVEFNGVVVYNVIYSDSEGKLGGTSFTSDYDFTVGSLSENTDNVLSDTRISNYALRLVNPRKLSAKCSLVSCLTVSEKDSYCPTGTAFNKDGERQEERAALNIRCVMSSESLEREYAEQICRLEGAIEDEVGIVYSKAHIIPESMSVEGDGVRIQGELVMCCLIAGGESGAYLEDKKIKIDEHIPFEGVNEGMILIPEIIVTSERASVRADEDGCEIVMDVIADFTLRAEENREVTVISDAFSTECSVENSYADISYTELVGKADAKEKHSVTLSRKEAFEGVIREVIFVNAEPKIESCEIQENGALIKGEIKYGMIVSEVNDDGTVSYLPLKNSSEFEQIVNINCQNSNKTKIEPRIKAINAEATLDAGSIYLSSELETSIILTEDKNRTVLMDSMLKTEDSFKERDATVTVYYPDSGETLFSVAKKFHVKLEKLCENNSIVQSVSADDSGSLNIKKLLIY